MIRNAIGRGKRTTVRTRKGIAAELFSFVSFPLRSVSLSWSKITFDVWSVAVQQKDEIRRSELGLVYCYYCVFPLPVSKKDFSPLIFRKFPKVDPKSGVGEIKRLLAVFLSNFRF